MRFNFSLTSFVFLKTSVSWGFSCFCCRHAACMCECFLRDLQKHRNIQYLLYRLSYPTTVSLTRVFWMLRAKASLISKSLCPVGSWQLLLAYLWLSVAASLRNSIVEQLICVWIGWRTCSPQLHPKVLCFITSVLILGPSAAAAGRFSPSQFSCWLPAMLGGKKRQYVGDILIKLSALLERLRRDWGRTWIVNLLPVCVFAVLPGRKVLSLSTDYEFLAPLCLLFQAKWSTAGACSNPWRSTCHTWSAALLQQGALGAAGQEPVVALALSPWDACVVVEPWQMWAQSLLPKINMNPHCSCVKVKGWTKLTLSS